MRTLATILVITFYVLHQDLWFWRQARPLVFGVLPVGLAYHAAFTLATTLLLLVLVRLCWPAGLESEGSSAE
jgi:hypothetical protein